MKLTPWLSALLLTLTPFAAHAQTNVLRVVPHSNLAILDPVWTTAYMTTNHGYMIYDTLFGSDENGVVKPQMVDSWQTSKDGLVWTFKLRRGLQWHDGKPVTGEDVTASLARWGQRDTMGQALFGFIDKLEATAPDGFRIVLKERCGFLLEALGKPNTSVPFIMPRRVAETDPFKQIDDTTGSGPYIFKRDDFRPGDKAVYLKNPAYQPRAEPPSGTAGGKRVFVDRVEWNLALRDTQAQINALKKGEVDIVELLPFEQYESVKADPALQMPRYSKGGNQFFARMNHLVKPFDNVKVRQAAMAAMQQEPFLRAQIGIASLYRTCPAMFLCDTPYASTAGSPSQAPGGVKRAKELLAQSGYDGTPIVVLKATDLAVLNKLPDVAAQMLRQAGFKVDLVPMDWQTLVARRAKKDPADKGGWNLFFTTGSTFDFWNPMANSALDTRGEQSTWFGWVKDDRIVELRQQFMRADDPVARKQLAEAMQVRAYEVVTHVPLGEYTQPMAARKNVGGFFIANNYLYWNLKKN